MPSGRQRPHAVGAGASASLLARVHSLTVATEHGLKGEPLLPRQIGCACFARVFVSGKAEWDQVTCMSGHSCARQPLALLNVYLFKGGVACCTFIGLRPPVIGWDWRARRIGLQAWHEPGLPAGGKRTPCTVFHPYACCEE